MSSAVHFEYPALHGRGRRGGRRRQAWPRSLLPLLVAASAGAATFTVLSGWGHAARDAPPLMEQIDRAAEAVGLGLSQVSLVGHRYTSDQAIFDCIDLPNVRSLARLDIDAVRARIERLPWVATAVISRVVPNGLEIRITERTPFAVWRSEGREHLIDATGRVLTAIPAGSAPMLQRVAGDGAPSGAAAILALAGRYPEVARRLDEAMRVGNRRWTLRLADGPLIQLPADDPEAALAAFADRHGAARLTDPAIAEIDLRIAGRITIRPSGVRGVPQAGSRVDVQ